MNLQSKYIQDENGVKFAPVTTPNAIRWPDGSNLSDKLSALDAVVIEAPVDATDATQPITTLTCEVGKYYRIDVAVDTLAVTLPAMTDLTTVRTVVIYLTAGTTPAITISAADNKSVAFQDGYEIEAGKTYEVNALFNGSAWVVDALTIKVPFFAKLTLNNGEVVELEGSGELTNAIIGSYMSTLVSAEIGTLCTSIGSGAFFRCSGLTSIDISDSVTNIGSGAFQNCTGLTNVTIGNSVTNIGKNAFYGCSGLTSIDIPNSVTSIGNSVFGSCSSLTSIIVDSSNTTYDSRNNCNAIIETSTNTLVCGCMNTVIPSGVTSIGNYAFSSCKGLTSIVIPDSVTSIGDYVFQNCTGLTSCTIGSGVTSISRYAFGSCKGLTSIEIPDGVTSIDYAAFQNCSSLTSITIPDSVTSISNSVFSGCTSLPVVDNISYADTYAVSATNKKLTSYTIKDGTRFIGNQAFSSCSGMTSVNIPDSVISIDENAFGGCSSLTSITIPSGVTNIGWNAFQSCTGLTSITSLATTAPTIIGNTFKNVKTGGTLTVPSGSSGYDTWMSTDYYYLGYYNWTKVEQ